MDMTTACFILGIVVSLITGVVQMLKITFNIKNRYVPAVSCVVGLVLGLAFKEFTVYSYHTSAIVGFVLGLSSCGLFDLSKIFKNKN